MEFDREGRRITKPALVSLLSPKKRGRGRPRKYTTQINTETLSESNKVFPPLSKKRRGRPRKNISEINTEDSSELKKTSETKIKLKLLETILGVYKEIKNIEKENEKNIKKFYSLVDGLD